MKALLSAVLLLSMTPGAFAADWPECRQQKLLSLELRDALRDGELLKGYRNRSEMRAERRARDKWLWKNCRRYSGDLRELAARR